MRARWVPAVVALCLAVTACGGDDDDPPPATLPPVSPTASPSPSVVAVPTEATPATPEGAAAFVRFFYEQLEAAYATRDPHLVIPLVSPECESCERYIDAVTRLRDENARVAPYELDVIEVAAPSGEGTEAASVLAVLNIGEFVRYDAEGRETNRDAAVENAVQNVDLIRGDGAWLVREVTAE